VWLRCPWQSQIDREDNYAGKVQLAAGHTTRKHTLVHVALCRVPKDWNFSVLGVLVGTYRGACAETLENVRELKIRRSPTKF